MTFTTAVFGRSSSWQFGATSYKATPKDLPSSLVQHDALASSSHSHPEPDPTLHAGIAFVAAAREPMSPLDHADAALASNAPFLTIAKPTFLLQALTLWALTRVIGNAHPFDALCL